VELLTALVWHRALKKQKLCGKYERRQQSTRQPRFVSLCVLGWTAHGGVSLLKDKLDAFGDFREDVERREGG
jgi:hypothetical protein